MLQSTEPMRLGACAPQLEKRKKTPHTTTREKPVHHNEELARHNKRSRTPQRRSRVPQLRPDAAKKKNQKNLLKKVNKLMLSLFQTLSTRKLTWYDDVFISREIEIHEIKVFR